jgi:very-short-patch-repair endonuclease
MLGQTNRGILDNRLQRTLRSKMTDAERALWKILRHHQMAGLKFRRQHPFGDYVLDFVSLAGRLVIELDGGQHQLQQVHDQERTDFLVKSGFTILRFWDHEVLQPQQAEAVRERIWAVVQEKQPHPHPDPPLEGEGELEES